MKIKYLPIFPHSGNVKDGPLWLRCLFCLFLGSRFRQVNYCKCIMTGIAVQGESKVNKCFSMYWSWIHLIFHMVSIWNLNIYEYVTLPIVYIILVHVWYHSLYIVFISIPKSCASLVSSSKMCLHWSVYPVGINCVFVYLVNANVSHDVHYMMTCVLLILLLM